MYNVYVVIAVSHAFDAWWRRRPGNRWPEHEGTQFIVYSESQASDTRTREYHICVCVRGSPSQSYVFCIYGSWCERRARACA